MTSVANAAAQFGLATEYIYGTMPDRRRRPPGRVGRNHSHRAHPEINLGRLCLRQRVLERRNYRRRWLDELGAASLRRFMRGMPQSRNETSGIGRATLDAGSHSATSSMRPKWLGRRTQGINHGQGTVRATGNAHGGPAPAIGPLRLITASAIRSRRVARGGPTGAASGRA
jgi:hypothetical protein